MRMKKMMRKKKMMKKKTMMKKKKKKKIHKTSIQKTILHLPPTLTAHPHIPLPPQAHPPSQ